MKVRAKFVVSKSSESGDYNGRYEITRRVGDTYEKTGVPVREITLSPVYTNSEEDRSFAAATPSGLITFSLTNPVCADEFKVGDTYYVEFERAAK